MGFSLINQPFLDTPIDGNPHLDGYRMLHMGASMNGGFHSHGGTPKWMVFAVFVNGKIPAGNG